MKYTHSMLCFLLVIIGSTTFSFAQDTVASQEQHFKVTARVANATDTNIAHLVYYLGSEPVFLSEKLKNGVYTFSGTAPYPVIASFFLDGRGFGYSNGRFPDKLSLRLENAPIEIIVKDSVRDGVIKGGWYNDDYSRFKKFMYKEDRAAELANGNVIIAIENKAGKNKIDGLTAKLREAGTAWADRSKAYAEMYPTSFSSIDALSFVIGSTPDLKIFQPLFDQLADSLKTTVTGKRLDGMLHAARSTSVGMEAPDFSQPDSTGKIISLKDFRGKYLLLDFWASWCGPCRAENPNYLRNYKQYHDKGLEILGVALDKKEDKSKWLAAIHKDGLLWPQVSDLKYWESDVAKLYGIRSIPQNFLIDPQGKIIASNLRGEELGKKLAEIFK